MRKFAFTGILASLALATAVSSSHAKDDFSALLSDLTFPNALAQQPAARVADAGPVIDLPETSSVPPMTGMELPPDTMAEQVPAPQPVTTHVDAYAPGSVQQNEFVAAEGYHNVDPNCSSCASGCDQGCGNGCNRGCSGPTCTPYVAPQLPSSSFYQYWRSNACNTRVWDGYQNKCCEASKHTMGQCDCFKPRKKLCDMGSCCIEHPVDCGPAPACWTKSSCDTCDGN
ncbi:hypothetical protein [Stieleria varia]|uniref:Stigma-specific protein, Stig1 n=1 Tax=Stieleria varia TaxID=2528005 RepID=A0A5C6ALJ1_9BACT|nr:hypothetical protein [Stieleria varia]TWU00893.1 hypothetical protein Pla52n_42620 [Stieleria varia]